MMPAACMSEVACAIVSARCARSVCRLPEGRAPAPPGDMPAAPLDTPPGAGGGIIGIRGIMLGGGGISEWLPILAATEAAVRETYRSYTAR